MFLIKFQEYFEKMYSCSGAFTNIILQIKPIYLQTSEYIHFILLYDVISHT